MKKLILIFFLIATFNCSSQNWPIKELIQKSKSSGIIFSQADAFRFVKNKTLTGRGIYQELKLDPVFIQRVLKEKPNALTVSVPISNNKSISCDLVRVDLGNVKFTENNTDIIPGVKTPATYRGIVPAEDNKNTVVLTVNEDYLSLIVSLTGKTIQVTKADETQKQVYRLYNSEKLKFPVVPLVCGTKNNPLSPQMQALEVPSSPVGTDSSQDKCVNVFVDCFDSLYQWRGSNVQQTINFVYELFNMVGAGYNNERINLLITTINVWTTMDPYRQMSRDSALADLAANYQDNFWGNICVGLDFGIAGRSGIAGDIGRVKGSSPNTCPAYTAADHPFCYNDMNYSVQVKNFPTGPNTTGPQVYLVMHEIGHLLGARHTKWCGWKLSSNPDVFGALDSCGGMEAINNTTMPCAPGPPPTSIGATIMSYCATDTTTNFVNFNNGFGTLPGDVIRKFVSETLCIPDCLACLGSVNSGKSPFYALHQKIPVFKLKPK